MNYYVIQYRSKKFPDAGWTDTHHFCVALAMAEEKMRGLENEFYDKEWRIDPRTEVPPYTIGNSGTH